jgi:polysaccharide deacetylase family protein (PEP-CTERM system associated)
VADRRPPTWQQRRLRFILAPVLRKDVPDGIFFSSGSRMTFPVPRQHVLTVGLEDFFQVDAFDRLIEPRQWPRFERRLERSTSRTLELLDAAGARATFFVLGWIADIAPELVRRIAERGHEIASRGYDHRSIASLDPGSFRDDLSRSREAIERAAGVRVLGHRAARLWYHPGNLWALDVLAAEGYAYDSSLAPFLRRFAREPWRRHAHAVATANGSIWELPVSTTRVLGQSLPIAGGNYARQLPARFIDGRVARWMKEEPAPFVMYFHVWELDPEQPRVAAPFLQRVRQYRNLERTREFVSAWLARHQFGSAADCLGLTQECLASGERGASSVERQASSVERRAPDTRRQTPDAARPPITIVMPCFNEEQSLPYLANTLRDLAEKLDAQWAVHYVFVDDGSTDATWATLERIFGGQSNVSLVRHPRNQGIAAAIRTGILRSRTEIVCSIDCDCSYDPLLLGEMIPLLGEGVDLVTASPYHPDGTVRNVPPWRLGLSRSLSQLYRVLLGSSLSTYTSCFRVYRRAVVAECRADRGGFLGIAELLGRILLAGGTVVEYPATLEVRVLGRSKMKILRTIVGHLGLAAVLAGTRLRREARNTFKRMAGLSAPEVREVPIGSSS